MPHRVVIVGGGFAGLNAARALKRAPVDVTLIDSRNFHLFQPLLYQVATGALSPANIAAPLRSIFERQRNCHVLLGEAAGIDVMNRRLIINGLGRREIEFDSLIIAAGSRTAYFAHPEWEPLAPGLKTIEDATEIRRRLFTAFELAERESDATRRRTLLNFVIVGAGPTGVELAGALSEISRHSLAREFRSIDPSEAQIVLIERGERVLAEYPPDLSAKALRSLERLGVTVYTKTMVTSVAADHVVLSASGETETLSTGTVLWAAGVQASPLAKSIAEVTGAPLDCAGRLIVEPDLSLPGHPHIFAIGDIANYSHQTGEPLPGVAQVALQGGVYVAKLIRRRLAGGAMPPFHYRDLGSLATIGRRSAVAKFGKLRFSGMIAWLLWLVIHLVKLINFRNRLLVLIQWGWNFLTYDRSARLITGPPGESKTLDA
jgi:NADH dehydrogenase